MTGLLIGLLAALAGVIFWAAVRGAAKSGARKALDEHETETNSAPEAAPRADIPPWERSRHLNG